MKIRKQKFRNPRFGQPSLFQPSRYIDMVEYKGFNYKRFPALWSVIDKNWPKATYPDRLELKGFRLGKTNRKQYVHVCRAIAEERENAFKHHWYPVIVGEADYLRIILDDDPSTVPEVDDWIVENVKHEYRCTIEEASEDGERFGGTFYVYWFEDPDDAMMCRLIFQS